MEWEKTQETLAKFIALPAPPSTNRSKPKVGEATISRNSGIDLYEVTEEVLKDAASSF